MLSCNQLVYILDKLAIKHKLIKPRYDTNMTKAIGYQFHQNLTIFVKMTMSDKNNKTKSNGRIVIHPLLSIEITDLQTIKGMHLIEKTTQSSAYRFANFPHFLIPEKNKTEPYGTSFDFIDEETFDNFFNILIQKFDL